MTKESNKLVILNKKEGETPLEALEAFRQRKIKKDPKYKNMKMTYAGRLDPMASGALLVLLGDEVKQKEKYLLLEKEYEFEILFGFSTDTYDILGKVEHSNFLKNIGILELQAEIEKNLSLFIGKWDQTYPPYSARTWQQARGGEDIDLKIRQVEVKNLKLLKVRKVGSKILLRNIEKRIGKVKGDFRQSEIYKIWRKKLQKSDKQYFIASLKIKCGSGTYVRGIANSLGERMNIPALAYKIKRTKLGKWRIE